MEEFNRFKDKFGKTQLICKEIQEGIQFWKDELQISLEFFTEDSHKPAYSWISNEGFKKSISLNPTNHLKSKQKIITERIPFIIDNKDWLCTHGHLYPLKERMGRYISTAVLKELKTILKK